MFLGMPRAKQRTKDLHERGVTTALAVLAEEGVTGLTTRNVAKRADASVPAVYEVFGDKSGLIREVFFEGFRMLGAALEAIPPADNPLKSLARLADAHREFVVGNPALAAVMFSRPFADFDPSTVEAKAGVKVRKLFVDHVQAAIDADLIAGDATDIALVFFALLDGLTAAEIAHRLGSSGRSVERRWHLAVQTLFAGLAP